jgi:hypothetical protein
MTTELADAEDGARPPDFRIGEVTERRPFGYPGEVI